MNTIWHMFWTWAFFRNKVYMPLAVIGSVIPDLQYFLGLIYMFITEGFNWQSFLDGYQIPLVDNLAVVMHSFITVLIIFIIFFIFKLKSLFPIVYAWTFHILLDIASHFTEAYPIFWPLSNKTFTLGLSYWEEAHHSFEINLVNLILFLIFMIYLFVKKYKFKNIEKNLFIFFIAYLALNTIIYVLFNPPHLLTELLFLIIPIIVFSFIIFKN